MLDCLKQPARCEHGPRCPALYPTAAACARSYSRAGAGSRCKRLLAFGRGALGFFQSIAGTKADEKCAPPPRLQPDPAACALWNPIGSGRCSERATRHSGASRAAPSPARTRAPCRPSAAQSGHQATSCHVRMALRVQESVVGRHARSCRVISGVRRPLAQRHFVMARATEASRSIAERAAAVVQTAGKAALAGVAAAALVRRPGAGPGAEAARIAAGSGPPLACRRFGR